MAEELQTGVCGENWWTRSGFMASPCSVSLNDFGWPSTDHVVDMKTKYSTYNGDTISNSVSDQSSLSFQDHIVNQKPNQHHQVSDSESSGSILIDSPSQMMGFGLSTTSSPISVFNQALLNKKVESNNNFHSRFQEEVETKLNYRPEICLTAASKLQNDWSPNSQDLSSGLPISSSLSFGYRTSTNTSTTNTNSTTTSKLLQGLFDSESQPQQSSFGSSTISASFPGLFSSNYITRPKQLQHGGFNFSNYTTPFWNDSATSLNDIRGGPFSSSSQSQFLAPTFEEKPNFHILTKKGNTKQEIQDSAGSAVKKSGSDNINQPVMKRPRIETPSPLPTFKVRKEKLGDRITALQQLVSPFGKTDTASVLHEAIEYIKFLHDQVGILSTPYLKNGASNNINPHKEGYDNMKEPECPNEDLKSRGLCLVPISSTFPVGNETTADFWTPTFGSSFRLRTAKRKKKGQRVLLERDTVVLAGPATNRILWAAAVTK